MSVIFEECKELTEFAVNFGDISMDDVNTETDLTTFIEANNGLELFCVHFPERWKVTDKTIMALSLCQHLRTVNLEELHQFSLNSVSCLLKCCKHIELVSLRQASSNKTFIFTTKNDSNGDMLRILNVIGFDGLECLTFFQNVYNLHHISLESCQGLNDTVLQTISQSNPNLLGFDRQGYVVHSVSVEGYKCIVENCHKLQYLSLKLVLFSALQLTELFSIPNSITTLCITDSVFLQLTTTEIISIIKLLPKLHTLTLQCDDVDDEEIMDFLISTYEFVTDQRPYEVDKNIYPQSCFMFGKCESDINLYSYVKNEEFML
jgi:hypothetical protein